jgi:hypothetical protein
MMNFSMNYRKRVPMGIIQAAQVVDNVGLMPIQVARVPVVKPVVKPVVNYVAKVVESRITKPTKKDESYEVRENIGNSEKKVIIYTIGEEEEKHEEENIPVPGLEEPVIETLSVVVVPIIEEETKDDEGDTMEDEKQLHDVKKKKRRMKGVRK